MSKELADLEQSREIRAMLEQRWGCIPDSVMRANWSVQAIDLSTSYQDQKEKTGHTISSFQLSGTGARHGGLSRMPQNIVRFAVNFWCPEYGVVVDPFAGHNSRMESVWRCSRNYTGFDISHEFMEMNRKVQQMLEDEDKQRLISNGAKITLIEDDSRWMLNHVAENSCDFCITSPPFHDLEYYGPEEGQLGNVTEYRDFLQALYYVVANCYKVLKPGSFIAWEFNTFRKKGVFYPFFADGMSLFTQAGFALWDIVIIDYGVGYLECFASDMENIKITSKQHSYLVVARKPGYDAVKRQETRSRLVDELDKFIPPSDGDKKQLGLW